MKNQIPGTLSSAARQVVVALGLDRVGEIVRRSAALIYKWTDASQHYYPNLQQAVELDAEFVRQGKGAPPFLNAYTNLLKRGLDSNKSGKSTASEILPDAVKLVNLACEILMEINSQAFVTDTVNKSKAPKKCTICQNLRKLGMLETAMVWKLEQDLNAMICPLRKERITSSECSILAPGD